MSWLLGSSKVGLDEGYIKLADILLNGSGLKFFLLAVPRESFRCLALAEAEGFRDDHEGRQSSE